LAGAARFPYRGLFPGLSPLCIFCPSRPLGGKPFFSGSGIPLAYLPLAFYLSGRPGLSLIMRRVFTGVSRAADSHIPYRPRKRWAFFEDAPSSLGLLPPREGVKWPERNTRASRGRGSPDHDTDEWLAPTAELAPDESRTSIERVKVLAAALRRAPTSAISEIPKDEPEPPAVGRIRP